MLDIKATKDRITDLAASFKAYMDLSQKDRAKLTLTDRRRMKELEADLALVTDPVERSDFLCSVEMAAQFFGVTIRTVQLWAKRGAPKLKHGLYDLQAMRDWWLENIIGADTKDIEAEKLKYWRYHAEAERIEVETLKEHLIPRDEIEPLWASRMREVASGLDAFASRINPLIEGKDFYERQKIINAQVWELRDHFCRTGKFTPPEAKSCGK